MEEIGDHDPEMNTLDVIEHLTYAKTSIETLRVIRFFLEDLKPVKTADIEPEDCTCAICTEDFTTDSHRAVRLPCNHIFGKTCIEQWLRPYASLKLIPGEVSIASALSLGSHTCPQCRRVLFHRQRAIDSLTNIEMRIKFWDMAYAYVGIALSENERRAREDLLRYLGSYSERGSGTYYPYFHTGKHWMLYPGWLQNELLHYSLRLKNRPLTPRQEYLRQGLENNAKFGFVGGVRWWRNDQDELFYAVGPKVGWKTFQFQPIKRDEGDENEEGGRS